MTEISILVPVYNVDNYLEACLKSILAQTFRDYEVICMDDGSVDKSGEILDRYASEDSRIKVIHKHNEGYGKTMNEAMLQAQGRYVGIVESDDTIEQDMFQVMYETAEKYNLDMVKTDFYKTYESVDGAEKRLYSPLTEDSSMYGRVINPNKELYAYLLEKFTWNALYRREYLMRNNVRYNETPGAAYQDNGFWFQTFYWAERVMFLDTAFYKYRQDNPSSSFRSLGKVNAMKHEFDFIREFMLKHHDGRRELYKICFHLRMLAYLFTLGRIDLSLKMEFARSIKIECAFFEKQGEAYYGWLDEMQAAIIRDPVAYVDEVLIGFKEIENAVRRYHDILVYGAGRYGERVVCRIKQSKAELKSLRVAVTELRGKKTDCQGVTVYELADCQEGKETCLVILAVREGSEAFQEMLAHLKKLRFSNIISAAGLRL